MHAFRYTAMGLCTHCIALSIMEINQVGWEQALFHKFWCFFDSVVQSKGIEQLKLFADIAIESLKLNISK